MMSLPPYRYGNHAALRGSSQIEYTLYDNFTTDRAAGAVNGTTSESPFPTGGGVNRTVVDTGGRLSISGGQLTVAAGGSNGDPAMWYTLITRTAGMLCVADFPGAPDTDATLELGWDTAQSGLLSDAIRFSSAGSLQARFAAGSAFAIGVWQANTAYTAMVVPRASGCFFLARGGAFTTWRLLWASAPQGTANLYPGYASGLTNDSLLDNLRVPDPTLYAASVMALLKALVYDSFTRADGALGNTETTDVDGQSISALAWAGSSTFAIASNVAVNTPTPGADVIVNGDFDTDTDWDHGVDWVISGGVATATATTSNMDTTVDPLTVGVWYRFVFTISGYSAGTVRLVIGSGPNAGNYSANGTFVSTQLATGTNFMLDATTSLTASFDNVSASPLTFTELITAVQVSSTPDIMASVEVAASVSDGNSQGGMILNLDSTSNPQNFVLAYIDREAGNAYLWKCVAGAYTLVASGSITYSATNVLRVIKDGTSYALYYQNSQISTTQVISDAGIVSNTLQGLFSTTNTITLNNFTVRARGTSGEYESLGAF